MSRAARFRSLQMLLPVAAMWLVAIGCDRAAAPPTARPAARTVASMVPAATDLLLAMGAGDRLVAVSNYDVERDGTRGLPRVGDYQSTDWERLRALRPAVMVRQFGPDRVPQGLRERSVDLGIELVNIQINRLQDVFAATEALGKAMQEPAKAAALQRDLRARLDAVRARVASRPKVRVLVVRDEAGLSVIGPGNFMDDLLPYAGAVNAAAGLNNPYPEIDRELLRALDPDAIVQLLPEAGEQKLSAARATWATLPGLRAVREGRVYPIADWYALLPGAHLPDVAERIATLLHPGATTTTTTTRPSGAEPHSAGRASARGFADASRAGVGVTDATLVTWASSPCERSPDCASRISPAFHASRTGWKPVSRPSRAASAGPSTPGRP